MMICNEGRHCPLCNDSCESYIEVAPVHHGYWIEPTKIDGRFFDIPHCSVCEGVPCGVDKNTKFCPNCGARMDEVIE